MSMKIPLIESQRSAPESISTPVVDNFGDRAVANAVAGLGDAMFRIGEMREEKNAKASIFAAENEVREWSREAYLYANENQLGKNALPDTEKNYKGVYGDYSEKSERLIADKLKGMDPKFQDMARQRLGGVVSQYQDRFAIFQSSQESLYRKEQLKLNVDGMKTDINLDMRAGGNVDSMLQAFTGIEELVKQEARGGNTAEYLEAQKLEIIQQSITAKAENDPLMAKEMLDDKRVMKALDPTARETLLKFVEQKRIEKVVKDSVAEIESTGLGYAAQLDLARTGLKDDPEALKKVISHIDFTNNQNEKIESSKQTDLFLKTYEDIVDQSPEAPTPTAIYSDPQFEILDPSQREWLVNKLTAKPERDTQVQKANDFFLWTNAQADIYTGNLTEEDLKAGVAKYVTSGFTEGIPPQYGKELFNDIQKAREAPQIGSAAGILKGENEFDAEDQSAFNEIFYREVKSATVRNNGITPSYEQILEIGRKIAKPINEKKWFQKPRFKDKNFVGLGAEEDAVMAPAIMRQMGWDGAEFDEPSGMWYGRKGERGFRYDPRTKKTYEFLPAK